jgi:hypothetical protein
MRKLMNLNRKAAIVAAGGVAVVALSATAAFAYWTTSGSGTGTAATGKDSGVAITQDGSITNLVLDGTATVNFTVTNSAANPQYVSSVSVVVDPKWSAQANLNLPACTASDFSLGTVTWKSQDLAANGGHDSGSVSLTLVDNPAANQDNCKNATVKLLFSSN